MADSLEVQVGAMLRERQQTLSVAESCTGGLIAHRLTNIAGSSAYFPGGIVAYAYEAKTELLHVNQETLLSQGAVSEPIARQMAQNVRAIFGTDFALAVTGIAGPGGGTPEKPVGLTYIACATPDGKITVRRHIWNGDRDSNKNSSADAALNLLIELFE